MFDLFKILPFRNLRQRPIRTVVAILGISSGVALYVSIAIINSGVLGYFKQGVQALAGDASLVVATAGSGIPQGRIRDIQQVPGVLHAVPSVESASYLTGMGKGVSDWIVVLGVDPARESQVRRYRFTGKEAPANGLAALREPETIIVTGEFSKHYKKGKGDSLELMTQLGKRSFRVAGVYSAAGGTAAEGRPIALVSLETGQRWFGEAGQVNRIDIVTAPGADPETVSFALMALLGSGVRVSRPETQVHDFQRMVRAYQALLLFLSGMALLVGMFVLSSIISMSVAEQRREIGTLRALGATRVRIFILIQAEVVAMAVIGAGLGVAGGRGMAVLLVGFITQTLSNQYMTPIAIGNLHYGWDEALWHILLSVSVAVISAFWVAFRATRIEPVEAIRRTEINEKDSGGNRSMGLHLAGFSGMAVLVYLGVSVIAGYEQESMALQMAHVMAAFLASVIVAPWVVINAVVFLRSLFGRVMLRSGMLYLSVVNISRLAKRTSVNVLSLIVGLLLIVTVSTIQHSFDQSLETWLERILYADLVISSPGRQLVAEGQDLHEDIREEINAIPGIDVKDGYGAMGVRFVTHNYKNRQIRIKAFDRPHPSQIGLPFDLLTISENRKPEHLFESKRPSVLISKTFAKNFGKRAGDSLHLITPSGETSFEILGEVIDFASPEGVLYLSRDVYKRLWNDYRVNLFTAMVDAEVPVRKVYDRVNQTLGREMGVFAFSHQEMREQMQGILRESFSYTFAIESAALLVGFLGMFNTMMCGAMFRMREFGLLRAVGMSCAALRGLIITEALLQSVFGALTALGCGMFLAYLFLSGVLSPILGWAISFNPPWEMLLAVIAIGIAMGVLAALLPAERSARIEIREALSYE